MMRVVVLLSIVAALTPSEALAWGCDGHQAVVMLAERLLTASTLGTLRTVLAASPVDPGIKPYCRPAPGDPLADAATWADDNRTLDPSTASWHYIDFPLIVGRRIGSYQPYCPHSNCAVDAIVNQYRILTTTTDARLKGNALRYVLHFVGDLHQPLHTTTNGDRGGNCMPITYYGQSPVEDERHDFRPNLHSVWDDAIIRRLMTERGLADARGLADYIARERPLRPAAARAPTSALVASWAKDTNAVARSVTYGRLPVRVAPEPANTFSLASCEDNNHASRRFEALGERVDERYEAASVPAILSQLRLAAERLASALAAAAP